MTPRTAPSLTAASIAHGFFGRAGGVSQGIYESLNCGLGSGDDPAAIRENRRRVAAYFGFETNALHTLYQIHSPHVVTCTAPRLAGADAPQADAQVTNRPGIILAVLSADCAPVLFADPAGGVIGAAHAGWKGALGGVLAATVAAMEALGARRERIRAALGPCIGAASYEVGPEFRARFLAADAENHRWFAASPGRGEHALFDLPGYVLNRLAALGLAVIEDRHQDTKTADADYFSYRRATLAGEADYGRQISAIAL